MASGTQQHQDGAMLQSGTGLSVEEVRGEQWTFYGEWSDGEWAVEGHVAFPAGAHFVGAIERGVPARGWFILSNGTALYGAQPLNPDPTAEARPHRHAPARTLTPRGPPPVIRRRVRATRSGGLRAAARCRSTGPAQPVD